MTEILKPCPFCGGTAKPRVNLATGEPLVHCRNCGSWTSFDKTEKIKDGEEAAEAIIKAWNRRVEQVGWIKTSERLPEKEKEVLVYDRGFFSIGEASERNGGLNGGIMTNQQKPN